METMRKGKKGATCCICIAAATFMAPGCPGTVPNAANMGFSRAAFSPSLMASMKLASRGARDRVGFGWDWVLVE